MSIKNKIQNIIIALSLVAVIGVVPVTANAITLGELIELFIALEIIPADKADAARAVLADDTSEGSCFEWTRNLSKGSTGQDVKELQMFLNQSNDTELVFIGIVSKGNETDYFGPITANAVTRFQNKYATDILVPLGLSQGTGYFGNSTRAKIHSLCVPEPLVVGVPVIDEPVVSGVSIEKDINQPLNILAPESAARIEFTRILLKAGDEDVVIDSIVVKRTGLASNGSFSGVFLMYEDGTLIGTERLLNSHDEATLGTPFTIPANTTKVVIVGANMKAELELYAGEMPSFSVIKINTDASVEGTLPIEGATHTINSTLSIGSVVVSEGKDNPGNNEEETIGTENVVFSSLKIKNTSSSEDITVHGIRFYNAGTISIDDLDVVVRVNDGLSMDVVTEGRYFSVSFPVGVTIKKGKHKTFNLEGDIAYNSNAVGRTIRFEIDRAVDINIKGNNFGYGILPQVGDFAEDIEIITGNIESFSRNNSVTAENVMIAQSDQVLGGFKIELEGEGIHINTMVFNVSITGSATASDLKDVSLVDEDDTTLAGPVDGSVDTITFNDVELPIGVTKFTLQGELTDSFSDGDTFSVETDPSSDWNGVRGVVTDNTIALAGTSKTSATQTASDGGALSVIEDSTSPEAMLIMGGERITLGVFKLMVDDSEDILLKEVVLTAVGVPDVIAFYELYNAEGGGVLNYSTEEDGDDTTFTFDNLVLEKDTDFKLVVKAVLTDIDGTIVVNGDELSVVFTSFEAEGDISEKELLGTPGITGATHVLYEAFPSFVWDKEGQNAILFPQGRMPIDTLLVTNNGDEDITVKDITLSFLGDYGSLGDIVLEDKSGSVLATEAGTNLVVFSINLDIAKGGSEEVNVYADTLSFGTDSILQVMLEDVSGSIVWSIDSVGSFESKEILPDRNLYSRSLTR